MNVYRKDHSQSAEMPAQGGITPVPAEGELAVILPLLSQRSGDGLPLLD